MTMVALGAEPDLWFHGQFSLGQWGFYGIGAYCAADITFRCSMVTLVAFFVVGLGVLFAGLTILAIFRWLEKKSWCPGTFGLYHVLAGVVISTTCGICRYLIIRRCSLCGYHI